MKKRIVITLLSLFLFSQNVYAAICYCSEYEHINFKLRIANYEGDYGASPAIANDGTIYFGKGDDNDGTFLGTGNVFGLNKTGSLLWNYTAGSAVFASPSNFFFLSSKVVFEKPVENSFAS